MPNQKTEEHGYFSKSEKPRLNRFYSRGRVAYCSIQNLRKASGLSKKKGENFSGHRIQNWVVSKSVVSQDLKLYLNTSMKSVWTFFLLIIFQICHSSNNENKVCHRHFTRFQKNDFSKKNSLKTLG